MKKILICLFAAFSWIFLMLGLVACEICNPTNSPDETLQISVVSKEIEVEETFILTAIKKPSGELTYETSNAQIVSVTKDGIVTGVSVGTANIIVSVGDKTAVCKVEVKEKLLPKSPLSFLVDEMRIRMGGTPKTLLVLCENILVQSGVVFQTVNPEIATVSEDGVLSAVSSGETTVIATYGDFIARMKVTVEEFIYVELQTETTYLKVQETANLKAKVLKGVEQTEANVSGIEWTIDFPEVAELCVEDGVATVKGLTGGVAILTASYEGVEASTTISVAHSVTNFKQLKELAPLRNGYIVLENDIDLSNVKRDDWTSGNNSVGVLYAVIPELNALLDGNGKKLYGLTLKEQLVKFNSGNYGTPNNVGFFGVISVNAGVKNLVFDGSLGEIISETNGESTIQKIQPYVGSHVGLLAWKNQGIIQNTYVSGQIITAASKVYNGMWTVGMVFINTGTIESVISDIHFQKIKNTQNNTTPVEDVRRFAFVVSNQGKVRNCVALNEQYKDAVNADKTWTTSSIVTVQKTDKSYVSSTYTWGGELSGSKDTSDYALPSNYQSLTQHADENRIDCFVFMTYADLLKLDGKGYDATCVSWTDNAYALTDSQKAREKLGNAWSFDVEKGVIKLGNTVVYQKDENSQTFGTGENYVFDNLIA